MFGVSDAREVEIRWTDVDAFGHVHHIALVAIAEHARSRWIDEVLESPSTWPYAIVRIAFDYRSQITFEERTITCEFQPVRVGKSSVQLNERLLAPDGRVVADAESVIVAWDEKAATTRPLSDDEAKRLRALAPTDESLQGAASEQA
jgi:acyl-CoA thioester hydrolase